MTETQKYRHLTRAYLTGNGVDVGSGGDPVVPTAIQIEMSRAKDYGQRQMPDGIEWEGDGLNLPFRDGTLDYVYSSHLIEDFADWRPALAEWSRVLKPGGRLVILLPDKARWAAALRNGQPPNLAHQHEGSVGELSTYAKEFGWDVIEDRLTDLDQADYSILFVAKKRFDAVSTTVVSGQDVVTIGHSGDLGDCLAHAACMRALVGPNRRAELVFYPAAGVRQPFDHARAHNLGRLLGEQPWVRRWRFETEQPGKGQLDYDFADWREWYTTKTDGKGNLARTACEFYNVDQSACDVPWLKSAGPLKPGTGGRRLSVLIARSHRYRDADFPWAEIVEKFKAHAFFIGSQSEAEEIGFMYGMGNYLETGTLADVAQVVDGADLIVTNQTSTFWIAEGMKKPAILMERFAAAPNCDFPNRPGTLTDREAILRYVDAYPLENHNAFKPVRRPQIVGVQAGESAAA